MSDRYGVPYRDTARPARFFFVDARALFPVVVWLFHMKTWTLAIAAISIGLLYLVERKGMNVPSAVRSMRSWLAGRGRPAVPVTLRRRLVDWDFR